MEQHIADAVNSVWGSLSDNDLRELEPPQFYKMISGLNLTTEDAEDAWYEFTERVARVFYPTAPRGF